MQNRAHRLNAALAAGLAAVTLALASPAAGQVTQVGDIEPALRSYFEGRRVVVRMDMPGSADGVDLHLDAGRTINVEDYRNDLRRYGVAIRAGDPVVITLVKVKKDLIEFQLGGGGFGTFGDDTSTSSNIRLLDKSERERDLEQRIKRENDRDRKRSLERDLDDLRDRRERENRRLRAESERIEAIKRDQIAEKRLVGGSRFNLRYNDHVPPNLRPDDVVKALTEYVDFRPGTGSAPVASRPADISQLRKGMSRSDAERMFGPSVDKKDRREGGLVTTTLTFDIGDQRIAADFVEDVLVRYTVSSK